MTTDGTASLNTDGYVPPLPTGLDEESCEGSLDNPETCTSDGLATGGGAGGSATNTGSTDSTSSVGGGGAGSVYFCSAGSVDCPPVSAVIGINADSASSAGSTGGGAGSTVGGSGAGGGDSTSPVGSDSTDSKGEEGGGSEGEKADKDDAKPEEGAGGGPGGSNVGGDGTSSTGGKGGGAGSETYRCEKKKNGRVDCTKTEPKCEEGLTASGGYCSSGGTSDSTSSTGTPSGSSTSGADGSTTTSSSTPKTTTSNGKSVGLKEVTTHPDGTKTWTYEVCEVSGQDLSNWVLGTGTCQIVSSSPNQGFEKVSPDPNSGITGVKWNTGGHSGCQTYSVTTKGGTESMISVSTKAPGVAYGMVAGPKCN